LTDQNYETIAGGLGNTKPSTVNMSDGRGGPKLFGVEFLEQYFAPSLVFIKVFFSDEKL
jgi:hypothetical protein